MLQLEPHTIFVAREADGGANHSTGILEPNEVKVIMCHAGRSYLMWETWTYIPKVTFISLQFIEGLNILICWCKTIHPKQDAKRK